MSDYQLFFILLGAILGCLIFIGYTLNRILNIMIIKNRGEPSGSDLNNLSFDEMAKRKK